MINLLIIQNFIKDVIGFCWYIICNIISTQIFIGLCKISTVRFLSQLFRKYRYQFLKLFHILYFNTIFNQTNVRDDGYVNIELRENLVIDLSKKHAIFFDGQDDFIPKRNDCKIFDVSFKLYLLF